MAASPPANSTTAVVALGLGVAGSAVAFKMMDQKHQIVSDIRYARKMLPLQRRMTQLYKEGKNVVDIFHEAVAQWPDKSAIEFDSAKFTFRQLDLLSNKIANWSLANGLSRGQAVALVMENRPEYFITWMGLAKIGVEVSLINYNLKRKPLLHSLSVCGAKFVIFGSECTPAVAEVQEDARRVGLEFLCYGGTTPFSRHLDHELESVSDSSPSAVLRQGINMYSTFGYIYTSGTTGLPKAAVIKHGKMLGFGFLFKHVFEITSEDRVYCVLPLYHSAGGGCGVGMMLAAGATLVLRRKFSASQFWTEVAKFNCTVVQYIGELCRYLLAIPPSPSDTAHHCRIAIGNGLRPEIWGQFQKRFNVPEIGEFYGATEGNIALVNHCIDEEAQGKCGRMGSLMMKVTGARLVKFDIIAEEPIRGKDGFCIDCDVNEPGELVGPILDNKPYTRFEGYTDPAATAKKVLRDAFVKGDKYFRTGDLLMRDAKGFFHFVDRIGDTFRWKGENVSTTEVSQVVSTFPGVLEPNVYGVAIPGKDGRACMVAMVAKADMDFRAFLAHCKANLPTYAIPLFVRMLPEIEITSTFKHRKVELVKEGFNPAAVTDKLYWWNPSSDAYERIDQTAYDQITSNRAKL